MPTVAGHGAIALVPDRPRWVEARSLLLDGRGRVFAHEPGLAACVVLSDDRAVGVIVGRPHDHALADVVRGATDATTWLWPDVTPGTPVAVPAPLAARRRRREELHVAPNAVLERIGPDPHADVRWVMSADAADLSLVDRELRQELEYASHHALLAAAFESGVPVSFGYASHETESWWTVNISTVAPARRRGHARAVAAFLIDHHRRLGKSPVWHVPEGDAASRALARRLGFVLADGRTVFSSAP